MDEKGIYDKNNDNVISNIFLLKVKKNNVETQLRSKICIIA